VGSEQKFTKANFVFILCFTIGWLNEAQHKMHSLLITPKGSIIPVLTSDFCSQLQCAKVSNQVHAFDSHQPQVLPTYNIKNRFEVIQIMHHDKSANI